MYKFFALCFLAIFAVAAAKPSLVAPVAYSAVPYTAAYTAAYTAPYYAAYASPYSYAAAYSAYPYAAPYLLR